MRRIVITEFRRKGELGYEGDFLQTGFEGDFLQTGFEGDFQLGYEGDFLQMNFYKRDFTMGSLYVSVRSNECML